MGRLERPNQRDQEFSRPKEVRNLLAEWRQDYRMAKVRDETGAEPRCEQLKSAVAQRPLAGKEKTKSQKVRGIDIPF